jgi:hypothetical protein
MALVTRQILGIARGTVGDLVYKNRRGNSYVAPKPGRYKKTKCIDSINNRNRFGLVSKFSSVVNESVFLKALWNKSKLRGKSAYTKIYIHNYPYCRNNFIESYTNITPPGRDLQNLKIVLNDNKLKFTFKVNKELIDSFAPPYLVIAIVYLYQPIAKETPENREIFMTFEQEIIDGVFHLNDINELPLKIEKGTFKIVKDYKKAIVYFTIISFENKHKVIDWTNGTGNRVKGFEFFDAEILALQDLKPKKPDISNEPVNNFRIR